MSFQSGGGMAEMKKYMGGKVGGSGLLVRFVM